MAQKFTMRRLDDVQNAKASYVTMSKKDWLIVAIMFIAYCVMTFVNLGTFKTPKTYFTSVKLNEYFIVDLGAEYELERITYFTGVEQGATQLRYQNENGVWVSLEKLDNTDMNFFKHHYLDVNVTARYIKFITTDSGSQLYEVSFFPKGSTEAISGISVIESTVKTTEKSGDPSNLFDESHNAVYKPSYFNSTYFDEVYHGRTAYEMLNKLNYYEWTHPQLGKILIAIGMWIFGQNMFGMRFMGALFGALLIPLMYLFGKKIFKNRIGAFSSAFLMMFDFMHFTHSRFSTIDVYVVTFVLLMYYFMYDYYVNKAYTMGMKKSIITLFLSGLFMGMSISVKWNAAYGAVGLAVLFFSTLICEKRDLNIIQRAGLQSEHEWTSKYVSHYVLRTGLYCCLAFIIIPAAIYFGSYFPYFTIEGADYNFRDIINLQSQMFEYHSGLTATHPYQSPWYSWPFIGRPLYMYASPDAAEGMRGSIVTLGNPAIWWVGIVCFISSISTAILKKDKRMVPVFVAILTLYLPWLLVSRCTFIYHFFPILPFMIFCISYVISNVYERYKNAKYFIFAYFVIVALLFVIYYPVLSGIEVPGTYINALRLFPSWGF